MGAGKSADTLVAAGALVVLVIAVLLVGGTFAFGVGPFGGEGGPAAESTTPTATDGGSESDAGGSANGPDHVRPFTVSVDRVEECGNTCRDVTASLTNNGGNPRESVTVTTEIYAGEDRVWKGGRDLGTLAPDETETRTHRVDVGYLGGAKIKGNGGTVTVVTTVDWSDGSATYREQRTVA